jgi:hypothetical protein
VTANKKLLTNEGNSMINQKSCFLRHEVAAYTSPMATP